ncbi:GntR family transcriptional regulator [Dietzia natronolimnaea]|uniref:GntR family transcriptional regulator n=1 Tax=Dietzia natronolimnaea TaxID=161920 RepID=UPI001FEBE93C|nr:GntR family transcriptional regulator [Dietzia natronolimnaea]
MAGVTLAVDPASAEPPFRQLKGQIVEGIRRGVLTAGTRMPAVRTLAEEVGVSTATAAKVYRELEESGMLEGRGRSGTFVCAADLPGAVLARAAEEFAERAAGAVRCRGRRGRGPQRLPAPALTARR